MRSHGRDAEEKMRSAVSFALVTSLIGLAVRVAARHSPFATVQQDEPVDSGWSRVRKLATGTELIVTVQGAPLANRYFVAGDESDLTVLNVDAPASPAPQAMSCATLPPPTRNIFWPRKKADGLCWRRTCAWGQTACSWPIWKVADLAQVVEQYGRHDITEVKTATVESNPVGCAFAGYYGGGLIGGIPGAVIGGAVGRDTGPTLLGMVVGWSIGAVYVYRKCRHKPELLTNSAP